MGVDATREPDAKAFTHARMRAVTASDVGRLARLLRPVGVLQVRHHATGPLLESYQLGPALDFDADCGQSIDQETLVLVLRVDQRVRIRAQPLTHVAEGGTANSLSRGPKIGGDERPPAIGHRVRETDLPVELERAR